MPDSATVTMTYTTSMSDNIVDEVLDRITNLAPTDTPFISSIGRDKCDTATPEWLEDTLDTAASNSQIEGKDFTAAAVTIPTRLTNKTQIMDKVFFLSESAKASKMYARTSELQRITGNKTKSLNNDVEYNTLNSTVATGDESTARSMDGALAWAHANASYTFSATAAGSNHITEIILNDQIQALWTLGGDPDTVLAPARQKRKISDFTADGRLTINTNMDQKKITMTVRIIETDFGTVMVMADRHIAATGSDPYYDTILLYQKSVFKSLTFRPVKRTILGKTADGDKYAITCERSLRCGSKKGVGKITNLSRVAA
uniref:Putative major capsid protein n=1 Tax=viral metagenome TaxID=1070528 RepID=A0A6M3KV44_9ZZZZ